jgi:hypothetical protein
MRTLWHSVALEAADWDMPVDMIVAIGDDDTPRLILGDGQEVIADIALPPGEGLQMALAVGQAVTMHNGRRHGFGDWYESNIAGRPCTVTTAPAS